IPYLQPHLHVPDREEIGSEPSMLLMIASRSPLSSLTREEAAGLLEFVYVRMYSKSFSDIPAEQAAYDAYLRELCQRQVELLPESVELLRPRDVHRVR
ncbi:MAG: hypothetical protein KDA75_06435, partial [Planctomycetaceae bacterium]|nr:hypothetical protein [Planctomycetaceae bacterium]